MEKLIEEYLGRLKFDNLKAHKNLCITLLFETLVGSALVFDEHIIHAAFFPVTKSEKIGDIAGYRRRRDYRTQNNGGHYE